MSGRFVSYLRVSTAQQGLSGLGLEAQLQAVLDCLSGGRWKLIEQYIEVESGHCSDRPALAWRSAPADSTADPGRRQARPSQPECRLLARPPGCGQGVTFADMAAASKLCVTAMARWLNTRPK
jgi:Resolvase, N terminal domain